jgi:AraC-like DNA-binding protein
MSDPDQLVVAAVLDPHGNSPFHTHAESFSEIAVVLRGRGTHVVAGRAWPITAGDVFVIHGDHGHAIVDGDDLAIGLCVYRPGPLAPWLAPLRRLPGYHALFVLEPAWRLNRDFRSRLHLDPGQLATMRQALLDIRGEETAAAPGHQLAAVHHFLLLALRLCRWYGACDLPDLRPLLRMGTSISHIEEHYTERLSVPRLARMAGLSVSEFHRVFLRATGTSPIRYLTHLRIRQACTLLADPRRSITAIAFAVGYGDSNYFSRQFSSAMGMAPRIWRRKL